MSPKIAAKMAMFRLYAELAQAFCSLRGRFSAAVHGLSNLTPELMDLFLLSAQRHLLWCHGPFDGSKARCADCL